MEHGAAGREVVRLKGGDPFVFGRGGEEAELLRDAGVPFEVVPGITAGIAAPAYAGIPVTHRDAASAVAFVTGHEDPAKEDTALDWPALAAFPGTLVVYMGVRTLEAISQALIAGGRSPSQPAAIIERGTLPRQRVVVATLETIASVAAGRGSGRRRSPCSARSRRCTSGSTGSVPGRWRTGPSRSPARERSPAGWPGGCVSWARSSSRRRRSGSLRSMAPRLSWPGTTSSA